MLILDLAKILVEIEFGFEILWNAGLFKHMEELTNDVERSNETVIILVFIS